MMIKYCDNSLQLMSAYYMLGFMLSALAALPYLILTKFLLKRVYHYSHCKNENTMPEKDELTIVKLTS